MNSVSSAGPLRSSFAAACSGDGATHGNADSSNKDTMILKPLQYNAANLLHSDDAVAIGQADGERLKDLIFLVHDGGWGLLVIETPSDGHFLIFVANRIHQGRAVRRGGCAQQA